MSTGRCPFCGAEFEFDDRQVGGRGQCYACLQKFTIKPAPAPVPLHRKGIALGKACLVAAVPILLVGGISLVRHPPHRQPPDASARPAAAAPHRPDGLLGAALESGLAKGDFRALQRQLDEALAVHFTNGEESLERALLKPEVLQGLAQSEILRACGATGVQHVASGAAGLDFLRVFLRSPDWMESFLISDPPAESYAQSLENLRLLFQYGKDLDLPIYRRMATAFALSAGRTLPYRIVERFKQTQQAHADLMLHAGFDTMDVREMRWAIYLGGNAADYQYLLDDRQTTIGGYFGSCWACWYRGDNDFGDSIQGPWYHQPWRFMWPGWETPRRVGGVCGTLSTFGSMSARAHGVPSTPVGQPGHCAYIIRSGEEWPVAYSVTWPTGASTPGWEGTGYATMHRLYEPVQHDRKAFLAANHALWAARHRLEMGQPRAVILPGLRYARYTQGVGAALPDFTKLTPESTGTASIIDAVALQPTSASNFGLVWEGQLDVKGAGAIRVATTSDDGSRVLIDGEPVTAANCGRGEGLIRPSPGRHSLRVELSQGTGPFSLAVELKGLVSYGDWTGSYEKALRAQPLNFATWLEYFKALETAQNVPTNLWIELAGRAASTFTGYPEAGWALVHRAFEKGMGGLEPSRRMVFLADCHRKLRQENAKSFEAFPFDGILNWQLDRLGDPQLSLNYFGQLLRIHTAKPPYDWIFGQVLNWGQARFAKDPKQSQAFAKTMESYFHDQGADVNPDLLRNQIVAGIRGAADTGDASSFRLWTDMGTQLLPPVQPGDIHLNPQQAAEYPKIEPFPGALLSGDALLKLSSACQYDRPLSFRQLLAGEKFGGYLDTNGEDAPWAMVQLPGDADISGVVLVNRYEFPPESSWVVPLRVSVSPDGKAWTPVATFDQVQPVYRVDLAGKGTRARYIKAERLPGKPDRFHLRGFLVYGKRLY